MPASTTDMSQICEFSWFDWVMFRDNVPTFPDDKYKLILGCSLRPATDVGLALTAKLLKSNGQTVCRLTLQHLTNNKIHCPIHQGMHRVFTESVSQALVGPTATHPIEIQVKGLRINEQDFPTEDLTPEYLTYDDDHDLDPDHGYLEFMPEIGDNYLSTEILIPRGETMTKGCVTSQKKGC
jgi:hypothetical protein